MDISPAFKLATVLAANEKAQECTLTVQLLGGEIIEHVPMIFPFASPSNRYAPESGTQVLIGFLDGDVSRCVVLGSLTSQPATLETGLQRFVTTGGTQVEVCEKQGMATVSIKTPKQLSLVFEEQRQTITFSTDDEGTKLTLDGKNRSITVQAEHEISLRTGRAELTLKPSGEIQLKGQTTTVDADTVKVCCKSLLSLNGQKAELTGTAMLEVRSEGVLTMKGGMIKVN